MHTISEPASVTAGPAAGAWSRNNPFVAHLVRHERLTGPGSLKDTRHFVLSLEGSGLTYTPGDSLGTFGSNGPTLVEELIRLLGFDAAAPVSDCKGRPTTLERALMADYIINRANRKIMHGLAERLGHDGQRARLTEMLGNAELLSEYIETRDYVDILKDFSHARFESPAAFVGHLTPVAPRLYSIASSPLAHPGEVHLCVAVVRYDTHGRPKKGLASGFLADHAGLFAKTIPVYVQASRTFRLPEDRAADIIMCGPGAGIAPFRAFVEHRLAEGAGGRNWLFFGEQHSASDFLYGEELRGWRHKGHLHRLDLAFSRDQAHKVYVQHRMLERAGELWDWLQNGAYFYVCGDARHMAKDVHQALIQIAREQGGLSEAAAAEYVNVTLMKTEKRYLRDVY